MVWFWSYGTQLKSAVSHNQRVKCKLQSPEQIDVFQLLFSWPQGTQVESLPTEHEVKASLAS